MKLNRILVLCATSSLTMASAPVFAQSSWYGLLSAGVTSTSLNTSSLAVAGATASSITKDDSDTGYKIQAGYQFNPNWGVEFGYVDLGKFSARNNVTAPAVGSLGVNAKADGWSAVAVGTLPLSNGFSLLGKLGTIYSTGSASATTSGAVVIPAGTQTSWKKSEWNWTYGLGVEYDINKTMSVRGELEGFNGIRVADSSGRNNVNLYSLGLKFKF